MAVCALGGMRPGARLLDPADLIIVPLSFSSGTFLTFPLPGLSLRWYQEFFTSAPWQLSLRNSLIVASATTTLATVLGTLAALGLTRARLPGQTLLMGLIVSPMVVPLVIVAVGVYFAYAPFGLTSDAWSASRSHIPRSRHRSW